ncbi:metallophosphoesterase family protein [uncultured Thermanaerothrix sp.]|uniref:metallophosphoesterase family protein n=1 Tax=uncultured Thermanaerothrix sp. TaxID=1195149 RepID=UPI0026323F77|nr:metallophosphoesterase family protein [uncultured Thermanaerothrix sp.]
MRILVISDVHANLPALEAVLEDAGTVDAVWCLGDLVDYGPDPNECVDLIRQQPNLVCLLGNHDAAVLGRLDLSFFNREASLSVHWTQQALREDARQFLEGLPERVVLGTNTLVHGSPRNPLWEYLLDLSVVASNFAYFDTAYCLVGHTHIPVIFYYNGEQIEWIIPKDGETVDLKIPAIANPGSIGQPRDRDSRAAYAIFDPDAGTWEFHRVVYPIEAVQERILKAGLPAYHARRLSEGV